MSFELYNADCRQWMKDSLPNRFHAIITDPPYGMKEYSKIEIEKMRKGVGGLWRIPPKIGGHARKPLPRFTVLTLEDIEMLIDFFTNWGREALKVLVPGGHVAIASNPFLIFAVTNALTQAGFENRGIVVRTVRTLKGGFRPKLAEEEFKEISSMPRSCWEPWGLFRKPFEGRLSDNLKAWGAGGLRRFPNGTPFLDLIPSCRTPKSERAIAPHPSLKPQLFMRQLVWALSPFGKGTILDPFCGGGSTLAAARSLKIKSVGIEIDTEYFEIAKRAVPKLSDLDIDMFSDMSMNEADSDKMKIQERLVSN